jgi:hypothetical protein
MRRFTPHPVYFQGLLAADCSALCCSSWAVVGVLITTLGTMSSHSRLEPQGSNCSCTLLMPQAGNMWVAGRCTAHTYHRVCDEPCVKNLASGCVSGLHVVLVFMCSTEALS